MYHQAESLLGGFERNFRISFYDIFGVSSSLSSSINLWANSTSDSLANHQGFENLIEICLRT